MKWNSIKIGLEKFGITILYSVLTVFHQFFGHWGPMETYLPETIERKRKTEEIAQEYERLMHEIDLKECVETGKTYEVCQTVPTAASY